MNRGIGVTVAGFCAVATLALMGCAQNLGNTSREASNLCSSVFDENSGNGTSRVGAFDEDGRRNCADSVPLFPSTRSGCWGGTCTSD